MRPATRPRRAAARPAAAAVEFAMLLPLLVTLLLGVWELGQAIHIYQIVANAAREGARQASGAKYTNDQVRQAVFEYLQRANVPLSTTLPASNVTLANTNATITVKVTNSGNTALDADQFTPMSVSVAVPMKNFRWILGNVFVSSTAQVQATAGILCLKDIPIEVDSDIPQKPLP